MRISPLTALTLTALTAAAPRAALAQKFVVSGDIQIARATDAAGLPSTVDPGNQRFFQNVLGGGTRVVVEASQGGQANDVDAALLAFYNALPGVSATEVTGPLTAADLAGGSLFLDAVPDAALGAPEVAALRGFSQAGGTVFLLGDNAANFAAQDANINASLAALGSGLQIVPADLDDGFHTVGGAQIAADPLTAGVTSVTYGGVSAVSGGTPLFLTSGGQPFVAAEGFAAVPEPSPLALLALGLLPVGLIARKRKK